MHDDDTPATATVASCGLSIAVASDGAGNRRLASLIA